MSTLDPMLNQSSKENDMDERKAKLFGWSVVFSSWLAVFCLFGYRATFAILKGPMGICLGWTTAQVTLGFSLMMVCYAVTSYFSGMILFEQRDE